MRKDKSDLYVCPKCGLDGQRYMVTGEIAGECVLLVVGRKGKILDTPKQARYVGREDKLIISTIKCPTCGAQWTPDATESLEIEVRKLLGLLDFYA